MLRTIRRGQCPKCHKRDDLVVQLLWAEVDGGERQLRAVELRCLTCGMDRSFLAIRCADGQPEG